MRAQTAGGSLDALLARARQASGAPYRYHVVSRSHETIDGRTFDVTTETEGLKYRARECLGAVCKGFYFDGYRSYDSNFNDTALPLSTRVDGLQATIRAIATYAFTDPGFRRSGGTLFERDPVVRDGKRFRRVAVAAPLGAVLDAIIDSDTSLVAGVVSDTNNLAFEFRNQRAIAHTITLPYDVYLNGQLIEHFDNRALAQEPLGAPAGIVPQLSGPATVAFSTAAARPLVPCTIAGQSVTCLLDTANSGLSMSEELAAKLGLAPDDAGIAGDREVVGIVHAPELALGAARFPAAFYIVARGLHQNGYDLILGADAFAHSRVSIDYVARRVTFAPANGAAPGEVGLSFDNYVPVLPIRVGDQGIVPLAADTAFDGGVEVAESAVAGHRDLFGLPNGATSGEIPRLRIGPYSLDRTTVNVAPGTPSAGVGRIGAAVLDHFTVTFDYEHAGIAFAPHAGDALVHAAPP